LGEEMGLVITDMVRAEPIGGRAKVFGEAGNVFDVAQGSLGRKLASLQILDHTLTQRCHGDLL
jgi:hypothetical protein